jgi:hypothetical protein
MYDAVEEPHNQSENLTSRAQQLFAPGEVKLPPYCKLPRQGNTDSMMMRAMSNWIQDQLLWKCHHKITSSKCYKLQYVDPFIPCLGQLQAALAEDYAWAAGWCSAVHQAAAVPLLPGVEVNSAHREVLNKFSERQASQSIGIRLCFLLTVYKDAESVMRLLQHLYSPHHLYLINVDSASVKLAAELRRLVLDLGTNIFIASRTPVVYMASSASRILAQGMHWFLKNTRSFDYLVSCTGSDYPLVPLSVMENVLALRSPPSPSVMSWSSSTWDDAQSFTGLSDESSLARDVVLRERRPPNSPMESRGELQLH